MALVLCEWGNGGKGVVAVEGGVGDGEKGSFTEPAVVVEESGGKAKVELFALDNGANGDDVDESAMQERLAPDGE
jgi:hypothetical protein